MEDSPTSQPQHRIRRRRSRTQTAPHRPADAAGRSSDDSRRRSHGKRGRGSGKPGGELPLGLPQPGVIVIMAMLVAALVLGGGGTSNPETEMVLQPLIAFLALLPLVVPRLNEGLARVPRTACVIGILVLLVPFVQLIPLPPSLWHALPGREMEIASLGLVGRADSWMPWSMAPARTFISLLAMVVPVLILLGVARTDLVGRAWLCATIVAVAAVSVMLGALQLTQFAGHTWTLYSYSHFGVIVGFQANHNAEADLLAIALMACGVIATALAGRVRNRALFWSGVSFTGAVMVVLIVLTGSRTGIALSTIALATFVVILWPLSRGDFSRRGLLLALGGGAAAVGVVLTVGLLSIDRILSRFSDLKDSRHDIWLDTIQAIHGVWPFGSGVGSFPPIFNAVERLEVVRNTTAGRAHNDWMEWTLEAGLPGWIVLLAILTIVSVMIWRRLGFELRGKGTLHSRAQAVMAVGVLVQLGVHALDDFPVREMSLAGLLAMAAAMLLKPRDPGAEALPQPQPESSDAAKDDAPVLAPAPELAQA